jgi:glycerophosphoryl diester phosphodiesterase
MRRKIKKWRLLLALIALGAALIWLNNTNLFYPRTGEFHILAHRGLAQTFDVSKVEWDTNTAGIIYAPEHPYLENTLASMEAAFQCGAAVVEFDIRLTRDGRLAVFHDFTLEYRTDLQGNVNAYTMAELKRADIGYGYTADGGKTWPFRGKGVGLMPSIDEVFAAFPDKEFLIHIRNDTGNALETAEALWAYLERMSDARLAQMTVYGDDAPVYYLRNLLSQSRPLRLLSRSMIKSALLQYALLGFTGYVPKDLHNMELHLPLAYARFLWGWPHRFIDRMNKVNTRVVIVAGNGKWSEGFDTLESLDAIPAGYSGYVWSNRADIISKNSKP